MRKGWWSRRRVPPAPCAAPHSRAEARRSSVQGQPGPAAGPAGNPARVAGVGPRDANVLSVAVRAQHAARGADAAARAPHQRVGLRLLLRLRCARGKHGARQRRRAERSTTDAAGSGQGCCAARRALQASARPRCNVAEQRPGAHQPRLRTAACCPASARGGASAIGPARVSASAAPGARSARGPARRKQSRQAAAASARGKRGGTCGGIRARTAAAAPDAQSTAHSTAARMVAGRACEGGWSRPMHPSCQGVAMSRRVGLRRDAHAKQQVPATPRHAAGRARARRCRACGASSVAQRTAMQARASAASVSRIRPAIIASQDDKMPPPPMTHQSRTAAAAPHQRATWPTCVTARRVSGGCQAKAKAGALRASKPV